MMTANPMSLDKKRILVTGASADSAIGFAICALLADLGASLVLVGRREALLEETRQRLPRCEEHQAAAMDLAELDRIPERLKAISRSGPLNGLVHSASFQGYSPLGRINEEQFNRYFSVNAGAPLMLVKGLRQKGVSTDGASVVFIGSVAGLTGQRGRSLYAASKAALVSLTQSLALEVAERGLRVNCVAPAVVQGPRAEQQLQLLAAPQREALLSSHPLGLGDPKDVANATAFLLSDASRWITGVTLPVDGGYMAH